MGAVLKDVGMVQLCKLQDERLQVSIYCTSQQTSKLSFVVPLWSKLNVRRDKQGNILGDDNWMARLFDLRKKDTIGNPVPNLIPFTVCWKH